MVWQTISEILQMTLHKDVEYWGNSGAVGHCDSDDCVNLTFCSLLCRDTLPSYIFPDMLAILARLGHTLFAKLKDDKNKSNDKIIHLVEITTECFRSLRNACAGCKRNQNEVLR